MLLRVQLLTGRINIEGHKRLEFKKLLQANPFTTTLATGKYFLSFSIAAFSFFIPTRLWLAFFSHL